MIMTNLQPQFSCVVLLEDIWPFMTPGLLLPIAGGGWFVAVDNHGGVTSMHDDIAAVVVGCRGQL